MGNPFVHVELQTQDLGKAKKFYQGLFDWKLQEIPEMGYTMVQAGEGPGGGMMTRSRALPLTGLRTSGWTM